MRVGGIIVPLTTGHVPIAINAVILYDYHSLSNETRSLPGSGTLLIICKAWLNAAHTLAGMLLLENCSSYFILTAHPWSLLENVYSY